ncbi:MAG: sulfite exporter TauE/SafE family protein [Candidatus Eisenbacteria bacterium]
MTAGERWKAAFAGLLAGLAGGLFGVGGGIVLVPMLTGFFGLTQHRAHGTSLAVICFTAASGVIVYALNGRVEWMQAAIMALASVATARFGARLAARTSKAGLLRAFAVFVGLTALRLLWSPPVAAHAPLLAGWASIAASLALGGVVGLLAGFLGIGGGVLIVPALTLGFGLPQQVAQGTSLALMLVTAPAGAFEHHRLGNVALGLLPMLGLGALLGAPLASQLAIHLPHAVLVRCFAVFLLATALQTWIRSARVKRIEQAAKAAPVTQ